MLGTEWAAAPQPGGGTDGGHHKAYKILAGIAGVRTGCPASPRTRARGRQTTLATAKAKANKRGWLFRLRESREHLAFAGYPCSAQVATAAESQHEQHQATQAQAVRCEVHFGGSGVEHLKGNAQVTAGFSIPLQELQPYNFCN